MNKPALRPTSETRASIRRDCFDSNGTLYAVEGDGGGVPEALFTVSTANASATLFMQLGAGSDGETIASTRRRAHVPRLGDRNSEQPNGEKFDKINAGHARGYERPAL